VIAEGTPTAIKAQGGGRSVQFTAPALTEAQLRLLPGVMRVDREGDKWVAADDTAGSRTRTTLRKRCNHHAAHRSRRRAGRGVRVPHQRRCRMIAALKASYRAELLKSKRVPQFIVPTIIFPILFFLAFGLPNIGRGGPRVNIGAYMLASYGAYSMMSTSLISFGVSLSNERGLGWNRLLRVTPMPTAAYFGAQDSERTHDWADLSGSLFIVGVLAAHVSLPRCSPGCA